MKAPIIETLEQAIAFGLAIAPVLHFAPDWAPRVFQGQGSFYTGPKSLNAEIQSQWDSYLSVAEKKAILVAYTAARLAR